MPRLLQLTRLVLLQVLVVAVAVVWKNLENQRLQQRQGLHLFFKYFAFRNQKHSKIHSESFTFFFGFGKKKTKI